MILLEAVTKRFGTAFALRGVDLEVEPGTALALFGHNGSGKTTLLKLVAGLLRPTAGTVLVGGRDPRAVRARTGYVGHASGLWPYLTVAENLLFYGRLYGLRGIALGAGLLDAVGMADKRDMPVHALSRGEVQRVAIARALLHDPDLLLADEPFSGLDTSAGAAVAGLLRRDGRTVLLASHDRSQAMAICDRAVTLERGRVAGGGPVHPAQPADADEPASPAGGAVAGPAAPGARP